MPPLGPLGGFAAALCLAAKTPASAHDVAECPSARTKDDDQLRFKACLKDAAAAAAQPAREAALYRSALAAASRLYRARSGSADVAWLTNFGDELVDYATEHCDTAEALGSDDALGMLTECIDLLRGHHARLVRLHAAESGAAQRARTRLEEMRARLARLEPPPPPPARTDKDMIPRPAPPPPPPPVSRRGDEPPVDPPNRPRRLQAGLAASATLAGGFAFGVGFSWLLGHDSYKRLVNTQTSCDASPGYDPCQQLARARAGLVVSSVGLGAALVATAVFTGLVLRDRARERRAAAFVAPDRRGLSAAFTLRF